MHDHGRELAYLQSVLPEQVLKERGLFPRHLRKEGPPGLTDDMEKRLVKEAGLGDAAGTLFPLTDEAYRRLNRKKGYRLPAEG